MGQYIKMVEQFARANTMINLSVKADATLVILVHCVDDALRISNALSREVLEQGILRIEDMGYPVPPFQFKIHGVNLKIEIEDRRKAERRGS